MSIARIFGKSPFAPLQSHLLKVAACIEKLDDLLLAIENQDQKAMAQITQEIAFLEHEADLTKNHISNHLPKSLFMPIARVDLLEILTLQDTIADKAEDISIVLSFAPLCFYGDLKKYFSEFWKKNIQTFHQAKKIISEFDRLLECSFGGVEAHKVQEMVLETSKEEHEADVIQYTLLKELYRVGDQMHHTQFNLWMSLIKEVSAISNLSEKLGNRIRMVLDID
jgi:uncharacterized protein